MIHRWRQLKKSQLASVVLFLLCAAPVMTWGWQVDAQTAWAALDGNGNVTGYYGAMQNPAPPGCCTPMGISDARLVAWQTAQNNLAAVSAGYASAISAGVTLTDPNSHCPPCVGTWAVDDTTETHIDSQMAAILNNATFTNGQATRSWPNITGSSAPTFTIAQFKLFATAIGVYKDSLIQARAALSIGTPGISWPGATIAIP